MKRVMASEEAEDYPELTYKSIGAIINGQILDKPVLQITKLWIPPEVDTHTNRWIRIELSDTYTECSYFFIQSPQLIQRLVNKEFDIYSIIQLKDYQWLRRGSDIVYINDMSVLMAGSRVKRKIDRQTKPIPRKSKPRDINQNIDRSAASSSSNTRHVTPVQQMTPMASTSRQLATTSRPMASTSRPMATISSPIANTWRQSSAGRICTKYLCQINEDSMRYRMIPSNVLVRARVMFPVDKSPIYKSCHKHYCFKRVMEVTERDGRHLFRCTKCVEETPHFQWRLYLAAVLRDSTGEHWVNLFDSEASRLLGVTAEGLSHLEEQEQYLHVLHAIECQQFIWKVVPKLEKYLFDTHIKLVVKDFWPIETIKLSKHLIKNIKHLTNSRK